MVFIQTDCRHVVTEEETSAVQKTGLKPPALDPHSGTGFFVGIRDKRIPQGGGFTYLITNRHVIQPGIEDGKPCEVLNHSLRLNLVEKNQTASMVIPLGNNPGWRFPDDSSVDLAALPIAPNSKIFDYEVIPTEEMATQALMASRNVVEGDSVLFSGLFVQYMGQMKMEPIVRTGTLAMLPDEPIMTTLNKSGKVYLAEAHAFGGNSGSPMFINLGGMRAGLFSPPEYKLLGVVSGSFFETEDLELKATSSYKGNIHASSGISMVVPIDEVITLLNSPDLTAKREALILTLPKQ